MNIIGVIAEYNPFHNGHLYQLNEIKKMYKDCIIIVILSGNFTQRGDVSIINKWDKTNICIKYGVDIVIELPFCFATQSADYFAKGAIELLKHLKVDTLVFGSESNNIELLTKMSKQQLDNNYNKLVKENMKKGINYPTALSLSLSNNINTPNDILGLCYIKEIIRQKCNIKPISIKRTNDYHSNKIKDISSASAIRNGILNNIDVKSSIPYDIYKYKLHFNDAYFNLLKYKIISTPDLSIFQTVDEGIDFRIKKYINKCNTFDELIMCVKSKRYTYNKIKRMFIHILCNFTKDMAKNMSNNLYIRLLGFNNKGRTYLNSIKKDLSIPIITKYTKSYDMLDYEIMTTNIYDGLCIDLEYKNNPYKN